MQHFSQEYKDKLIAQHKLVAIAISRLTGQGDYSGYAKNKINTHGISAVDAAILQLRAEKLILEAQIDSLSDFLD